jgi:hypothetical protein
MTTNPDANTQDRIAALLVEIGDDVNEIASTLVDDDEAAYPGSWAELGFDRGAAVSEYLWEIDRFTEGR